jgi:hypothetical protein
MGSDSRTSASGHNPFLGIILGLGLLSGVSQSYHVFSIPRFDQEKLIKYVAGAGSSCRRR